MLMVISPLNAKFASDLFPNLVYLHGSDFYLFISNLIVTMGR